MLIAALDDGRAISLVSSSFSRSELSLLRNKERFYCPVCRSPVLLKLGMKKKWHFAHHPKHPCMIETEPESAGHLIGKEDLFIWTRANGRAPELECYIPAIRQRPDIYLPGIRPIALEYQCSTISEETLNARTRGYQSQGIHPIWILGGARQKKARLLTRLSGFETLTIQYAHRHASSHPFSSSYYVCYYYPSEKRLCFAGQLHCASKTMYISQETNQMISITKPFQMIMPELSFSPESFKQDWVDCKRRRRLYVSPHLSHEEYWLRRQAYQLRLNYSYFPAFVGLPHEDYIHFSLPPCLWQMWLYFVMGRCPVDLWLTPEMVLRSGKMKGAELFFSKRNLPLCPERSLTDVIKTYLDQLVQLRAVERKGNAYRMRRSLKSGDWCCLDRLLKYDRLVLDFLEQNAGSGEK